MNLKYYQSGIIILFLVTHLFCNAGDIVIKNSPLDKIITFGNSKLMITLDYNGKCAVTGLTVDGRSVISGPAGIFSSITTSANTYSTLNLISVPTIKMGENTVIISNIKYGDNEETVAEKWKFSLAENDIRMEIERM